MRNWNRFLWILPAWLLLGTLPAADSAYWIWGEKPVKEQGASTSLFRLSVELRDDPVAAECKLIADDGALVFLNGVELKSVFYEQEIKPIAIKKFDLKTSLRKGRNVLALLVVNRGGPGGLILKGTVRLANGEEIKLYSNQTWRSRMGEIRNWQKMDFDDSTWNTAKVLGNATLSPWAERSNVVKILGE